MGAEPEYDVVIATDGRLPGGTAASTAEEISAQARWGLRSALIQVDSPLVSRTRPLNPRLRACIDRGEVDLILPGRHVTTRLLVIRHPKVALGLDALSVPSVDAHQCVVLINQDPVVGDTVVFRADEVNDAVRQWIGLDPLWAPIGPLVRTRFGAAEPGQPMMPDDWVNIIDVDSWSVPRTPPAGRPTRIGRHSRDHRLKWPDRPETVLAAYPSAPDIEVRVLGGVPQLLRLLGGQTPPNWTLIPFGEMQPRDFLRTLDVFVYFHHPDLIEAFGRTTLEAMATGLPVITDRKFEPLFGAHAIYAEPHEVAAVVRDLVGAPAEYVRYSEVGRQFARAQFGYEVHVRRVEALIGPRSHAPSPAPAPDQHNETKRQNVLFITPNGAGMGHLTRAMAAGRRLPADLEARFFTFSTAAVVVEQEGYAVEYCPSRAVTKASSRAWHTALTERLESLISQWAPAVVVIDGTDPYRGVLQMLVNHPEIPAVWLRRGMWKPGVTNAVLQHGEGMFDLVLEPGEFAGDRDHGATRTAPSGSARALGPMTYVDRPEMLDRETARRELGLGPDELAALVHLGAGNINDTASALHTAVEAFAAAGGWRVFSAQSPISLAARGLGERVTSLELYPLARHLAAFDVALAAAGYNSFHELLVARVPTGFVPNDVTITDDQRARAEWADANGLALCARDGSADALQAMIAALLDPRVRAAIAERLAAADEIAVENGAHEAASMIAALATESTGSTDRAERRRAALRAVERAVAGSRSTSAPALAPELRRRLRGALRAGVDGLRQRVGDRRLRALARRIPASVERRLRALAGFPPPPSGDRPSYGALPVPSGRPLATVDGRSLTRILVIVPGNGAPSNRDVVDAVVRLQTVERTFAPVFLTESLAGAPFADVGYVWEHLRGRERGAEDEGEWRRRRAARIEQVRRWYAVDLVVEIADPSDVAPVGSLLAQLVRGLDTAR